MPRGKRVYLSGGMEYAAGEGRDWRRDVERWLVSELGCTVFNPNTESDRFLARELPDKDFRGLKYSDPMRFREIVSRIVENDMRAIAERTDVIVCHWDDAAQRGAGTKGEISLARYLGKPVYLVTTMPEAEIPGWVLGCTTYLFRSFEDLKRFLVRGELPPPVH